MTDAEINKAVAALAGWSLISDYANHLGSTRITGIAPDEPGVRKPIPDYANSLDAIVPVVRGWCIETQADFTLEFSGFLSESKVSARVGDFRCQYAESVKPIKVAVCDDLRKDNPARALCLAFLQAVEAAARGSA